MKEYFKPVKEWAANEPKKAAAIGIFVVVIIAILLSELT